MRFATNLIVTASLAAIGCPALAECWKEDGRNRSAVELTACYMAEVQQCEELVPGFKEKASAGIAKLKSKPEYMQIEKSKDFALIKRESYKYLVAHSANKNSCDAKLKNIQNDRF